MCAGEGREAHLDRLLVADVGEHLVEDRQRRLRRRRAQARLVEQRGEAERLQRDRLAAGVRPADHERPQRAEVEVDRHGRRRVEQRMPRAEQPHLVRDLHRRAAPAPRDDPAGERDVDRARSLDERARASARARRRAPRARAGSARPPRARRRRPREAVVQLDDLERLDEERLARAPRRRGRCRARCCGALAFTASTGRPPRWVTKSSWRCSRSFAERARRRSSSVARCLPVAQLLAQPAQERRGGVAQVASRPPRRSARSPRRAARAPGRPPRRARAGAAQRRPLARARARTRSPPLTVDATRRELRGRQHAAARRVLGGRAHVSIPSSGGSADVSSSAIASAVSACRRATSSGRPTARAPRTSSSPYDVEVAPASRSTIAGNSSAASALPSTRRVYDRPVQPPKRGRSRRRRPGFSARVENCSSASPAPRATVVSGSSAIVTAKPV